MTALDDRKLRVIVTRGQLTRWRGSRSFAAIDRVESRLRGWWLRRAVYAIDRIEVRLHSALSECIPHASSSTMARPLQTQQAMIPWVRVYAPLGGVNGRVMGKLVLC